MQSQVHNSKLQNSVKKCNLETRCLQLSYYSRSAPPDLSRDRSAGCGQ